MKTCVWPHLQRPYSILSALYKLRSSEAHPLLWSLISQTMHHHILKIHFLFFQWILLHIYILGDQPKGRQSALLLLSKLSTFLLITQYTFRITLFISTFLGEFQRFFGSFSCWQIFSFFSALGVFLLTSKYIE